MEILAPQRIYRIPHSVEMALATAAITAERLAPDGQRVARFVGAIVVSAGLVLTARAVWTA